jgi:tetratricopeptide (TPR) repeat protein
MMSCPFRLAPFLAAALAVAAHAQDTVCRPDVSAPLEKEARNDMSARQYVLAARRFEEAFDACPENRSILLELAQAQVSGRQFDKAIGAAERYLASDAGSVEARVILANAYLMAQRPKDALAEAERILRDHPDQAAALKIGGNAAYLSGEFEKARDTLIRLLDRHPADEDGAYMLGRIYYQEGYFDLATGQFDRVLKINPGSYKALDNLGLCYQALGDDEKAMRYFLTAIKLVEKDHPEYEWPYTNVADLFLKNGDAQRAFDAAAKASNRNPMSARSFYIGAKALEQLGKTELSLNWLQRSVAIDAASSEAWYMLSRVYRQLHQNDKADEALQKFRELKAKEPAKRR